MDLSRFGARERFSSGALFLSTTRASGRAALFRLVPRALFADVRSRADFETWEAPEVVVRAPAVEPRVFVDGEVVQM